MTQRRNDEWKSIHKGVHTVLFHLHEVQEQTKLIFRDRSQNNIYLCGDSDVDWEEEQCLLDMGGSDMEVPLRWVHIIKVCYISVKIIKYYGAIGLETLLTKNFGPVVNIIPKSCGVKHTFCQCVT